MVMTVRAAVNCIDDAHVDGKGRMALTLVASLGLLTPVLFMSDVVDSSPICGSPFLNETAPTFTMPAPS